MTMDEKMIRINEALKKEGVKGVILIFGNMPHRVCFKR